jgi:hypothetical protein
MTDEQIEECWLAAEREATAPEEEWLLYGQKVAAMAEKMCHDEIERLRLVLANIASLEPDDGLEKAQLMAMAAFDKP